MKRYKLLKDIPSFKAGTECYIEEAGHMVPCRGISYVIVHKDQLEKNPNILTDWFEEINESTRWKPELGQKFYFLTNGGRVQDDTFDDEFEVDQAKFDIGNCFKTEEEAKRAAEYLKALAVVRGDATSKFEKSLSNWHVGYDTIDNSLYVSNDFYKIRNGVFGLPYFETSEDALRSIEQHKKEWLTIFGVGDETQE